MSPSISFKSAERVAMAWGGMSVAEYPEMLLAFTSAVESFVDGSKVYYEKHKRAFRDDHEVFVVGTDELFSIPMPSREPHPNAVMLSNVIMAEFPEHPSYREYMMRRFSEPCTSNAWLTIAKDDDLKLMVVAVPSVVVDTVVRERAGVKRGDVPSAIMECVLCDPEVLRAVKQTRPYRKYNYASVVPQSVVLEMIRPIGNLLSDCKACGFCASLPADGRRLLRCGGCKITGYCNAQCQRSHWKKHRTVCNSAMSRSLVAQKNVAVFAVDENGDTHAVSMGAMDVKGCLPAGFVL